MKKNENKFLSIALLFIFFLAACSPAATAAPNPTAAIIIPATEADREYIKQMLDILNNRSKPTQEEFAAMDVPIELSNTHRNLLAAYNEQSICLIQGGTVECLGLLMTPMYEMEQALKQFMSARDIPWPTPLPKPTAPPTPTPIPAGEEGIAYDGLAFTVGDVDPNGWANQQAYQFGTPPFDGMVYYVVSMIVQNTTNNDVMLQPNFVLVDFNGNQYRTGCGTHKNMLFVGKTLSAGEELSGLFCTAIPVGVSNLSLIYGDINLGLPN